MLHVIYCQITDIVPIHFKAPTEASYEANAAYGSNKINCTCPIKVNYTKYLNNFAVVTVVLNN